MVLQDHVINENYVPYQSAYRQQIWRDDNLPRWTATYKVT